MAKVHRAYRYSWWEDRFQKLGLFDYSPTALHDGSPSEPVKLAPDQQIRWLRATLVKMEEAHAQEREFDADYYSDDTVPIHRNLKAERVYAAAMGVTPRLPTRAGLLDVDRDIA